MMKDAFGVRVPPMQLLMSRLIFAAGVDIFFISSSNGEIAEDCLL
jgi:hypothetical protein